MSTTFGRGFASGVATAFLGIFALALPLRAQQVEHTSLALPAVAFIFSSAYIAEDAGIFKSEGLDVIQSVITGIAAANAVIAGSVDFSFSSGVTLTRAAAREQPVIAIALTYDRTGFWVLVRKSVAEERHFDPNAPLAERAKVMKGLRFGVGAIQAIPHAYLKMIAKAGGLDGEKDIVVAGMAPPDQVGAMERGAVDGVSSGPPVVEQLLHNGLAVVVANGTTGSSVDPPWLSHVAANVLMTRQKFCTDHRSICVKMGHAMTKASAFMHDHPKEAMAMLGKRLNVKDPVVLAEAYQHTVDSTPRAAGLDAQALETADRMNIEGGFMKESEKLPSYTKILLPVTRAIPSRVSSSGRWRMVPTSACSIPIQAPSMPPATCSTISSRNCWRRSSIPPRACSRVIRYRWRVWWNSIPELGTPHSQSARTACWFTSRARKCLETIFPGSTAAERC